MTSYNFCLCLGNTWWFAMQWQDRLKRFAELVPRIILGLNLLSTKWLILYFKIDNPHLVMEVSDCLFFLELKRHFKWNMILIRLLYYEKALREVFELSFDNNKHIISSKFYVNENWKEIFLIQEIFASFLEGCKTVVLCHLEQININGIGHMRT